MKTEYLLGIGVIAVGGILLLRRRRKGVQLVAGYNEVVYMGTTKPVVDAVAPILEYMNAIAHFDGVNWSTYDGPGGAYDDLATVVHGETYFLSMYEACFWSWDGAPIPDGEPPSNGVPLTGGISNQLVYGGPNRTLRDVISYGSLSNILVSFGRWSEALGWQTYTVDEPAPSLKLDDIIWHGETVDVRVAVDHFWSWQ